MTSITIGLTHYNRPQMLKESLKFILSQTFEDFKVIIGNDNPNIHIDKKFLEIENKGNIEIVNNSENLGEIQNMNNILNISDTEWFMWLADDDLLHPQFLEILIKCFELIKNNRNIIAFYSEYFISNKYNNHFNNKEDININKLIFNQRNFIDWYFKNPKKIIGCYGLMKTKILKKINGFPKLNKTFSPYSDDLLPLLLSNHGDICLIKKKLLLLRTHKNSASVQSIDIEAYTSAQLKYMEIFQKIAVVLKIKKNKNSLYTYLLNKKFLSDNFYVLFRNRKINLIKKILYYIKLDHKYLSKLNLKHLILYYFFIFFIPFKIITIRLFRIISKIN